MCSCKTNIEENLIIQCSDSLCASKHGIKFLEKNCLGKSKLSVERISVCNVIENWWSGIHCLLCSYTNDVIDMLP